MNTSSLRICIVYKHGHLWCAGGGNLGRTSSCPDQCANPGRVPGGRPWEGKARQERGTVAKPPTSSSLAGIDVILHLNQEAWLRPRSRG